MYGPHTFAIAGKHWAGATTPEKHLVFHMALLQPLTSPFCDQPLAAPEPLMMLPSNSESAMKPPLAYCGPAVQ